MDNNGFRKGQKEKALESLRAKLTKEELARIEEQREFLNLDEGTWAYKIALHLDSIRQTLRKFQFDIDKTLWSIKNTQNNINRCQAQLKSGTITEILKDTTLMNEDELRANMEYLKWTQEIEVNEIPKLLGQLRMLVGHQDLKRQTILSSEQFEKYVEDTILKLQGLGFDLL